MAVWSQSTNVRILTSGRCDAEYSRPEYLSAEAVLATHSTVPLHRAFFISDGNHSTVSRHFTTDTRDSVPYFRGQDLNAFFLTNAIPMRIPQSVYQRSVMRRSHFAPEDVLICIVGASTGTIGIVSEFDLPATGSCKIGIIRRRPHSGIDPYYLAAFLMGRFGQFQVRRNTRGTAQGGLILQDIYTITIPTFDDGFQTTVRREVHNAILANTAALTAIAQAQHLLESELKLGALKSNGSKRGSVKTSTVTISNTFTANRFDAQCFAPDALAYDSWFVTHANCQQLRTLIQSPVKGKQQEEREDGSIAYCSIKHISSREIVTDSRCKPATGTPLAETDDLLLAITGATIGKIGIVKRHDRLAFSGDLLGLRVRNGIDPHYLLLALDHRMGQVQFARWITGSTNGHLAPKDVGRVLVPRLSNGAERRVADLVRTSLSKRQESEQHLALATTLVERMIEDPK